MEQSRALGSTLNCPDLLDYVDEREELLAERQRQVRLGFQAISRFYALLARDDTGWNPSSQNADVASTHED
jgi:hypothetical protein